MKVVQVLPGLVNGGVERGTLEVAEALVQSGADSLVISAGGPMVQELEAAGSRHVTWNLGRKSPFTLLQVGRVRRWLLAERPDILHLRSRMPAWIFYLAWRGLPQAQRPRLVTTVHGLYSVSRYSAVMCRGERVIAVAKTIRDYILENYPDTDPERIALIYRGVDPGEFPWGYQPSPAWLDGWRRAYPMLSAGRVLTLPGRVTRLKGHHQFIDLIDALNRQGEPVFGLIVGGEDPKRRAYAEELHQRVRALGLEDRVIFTGQRRDIREIYAVSDLVFSLSTRPESFGRTVLEAISLGRPVVGYDHGGVGEILSALFSQGRVTLEDAEQLQLVTRKLLQQPQPPKRNDRFHKSEMLSATLQLYESLLSPRSAS